MSRWLYKQSTDEIYKNGTLVACGYSGVLTNKNNPDREQVRGMGPIPRGLWKIGSTDTSKGAQTITLIHVSDNSYGPAAYEPRCRLRTGGSTMIKPMLCLLLFLPVIGYAADLPSSDCAAPGHYIEGMLLSSIKNDLNVDLTTIQYDKTVVEVLSAAPVSEFFARQLAHEDRREDLKKSPDIQLPEKDYYGIYHDGHVVNVTAKYTLTDKSNKRDVFISSALANDDECSVRYNGYLTLSREF